MLESLFVLVVVYLAYLLTLRTTSSDNTQPVNSTPRTAVTTHQPATLATPQRSTLMQTATPAKPISSKSKIKPRKLPSAVTQPTPVANNSKLIKNPVTGETTTYTSYRFTKRWLKDALVSEGLLDKVYKNTELDSEVEAIIKAAVGKLADIAAYRE
jgi:hypothetical protein